MYVRLQYLTKSHFHALFSYIQLNIHSHIYKGKGKVIPLQARCGVEGG